MHGQEVLTLSLPPSLRQALLNAGFRNTTDFEGLGPVDLSREAGITNDDAVVVLEASRFNHFTKQGLTDVKSAAQLYERESAAKRIITFCPGLDMVLGGGISTGQITEFCGAPGVGKTQLGIQLSVDVQIPAPFKGVDGSAVYIDTEGSFMVERVEEVAAAMIKHLHKIVRSSTTPAAAQQAAADALDVDAILSGIHYFRARSHVEQLAVVHLLDNFLREKPKVRLVVMDSITFHFRQDFLDMAQRTRLLSQMAQQLLHLAQLHDVAVVLMNQVTTRIHEGSQHSLVPALGESWAHAATTRLILYWQDQTRNAFLYKSSSLPARGSQYLVTSEGVRGQRPAKRASNNEPPEDANPAKVRQVAV